MIGRQILLREWKTEGVPSIQEWTAELARVAAFERMLFGRLEAYYKKWGKYLSYMEDDNTQE